MWYQVWEVIMGHSLVAVGAHCLVYGLIAVWFDVPGKGLPWDKIGAVFCLIAGLGVGGNAAGWLGGFFHTSAASVLSAGAKFVTGAIGAAAGGALLGGIALIVYIRIRGQGVGAKTKFRAMLVAVGLIFAGSVAATIPGVVGVGDDIVQALTFSRSA